MARITCKRLVELHIDRGYVNSPVVDELFAAGGTVLAKPWGQRTQHPGLFTKLDFKIDLRGQTITCPAGEVEQFEPGETVHFDPQACGACPLRNKCTQAASGKGRTVSIAVDENRQRKFRKLEQTKPGRALLRKGPTSSMRSLTSRPARAAALGILVFDETSSTYDARLPFRIWKEFISYFGTLRSLRLSPRFHYVWCSRLALFSTTSLT